MSHRIEIPHCRYGHCARESVAYGTQLIGGYRCEVHAPALDIKLPVGWDWARVEAERQKWNIADNMVPLTSGPGNVVAWGTINSVRNSH